MQLDVLDGQKPKHSHQRNSIRIEAKKPLSYEGGFLLYVDISRQKLYTPLAMNVTELYRELKMTKSEFFETLREIGTFDLGERAIKIDDAVAVKIIEAIKKKRKEDNKTSLFAAEKKIEKDVEKSTEGEALKLPDKLTVKDFADRMGKRAADMIAILMQNGIMATINETLDYETAAIIAEDMGYIPELSLDGENIDDPESRSQEIADTLAAESKESLKDRAPVIVIMGHVDHGKTTLLDTIRDANVTASESGGITQHIGAYQVVHKDNPITFIDTPGHEAFTTMRSRGARVADIAVLVVAADDGIKPQTEEAIHIIEEAKIPFVVAINKIDKPEADVDRVKKELSEFNLIPEDYGGKVITAPISAKQGTGIEDLLDMLLLVAEVDKENIVSNPDGDMVGSIVESHMDKHMGPVATVLVQNGTLHIGEIIQIGNVSGRVRSLKDWTGAEIKEAGPSVPVQVLGLKGAPIVGDIMKVVKDKKVLKQNMKEYSSFAIMQSKAVEDEESKKKLHVILRADKLGSLEAIVQSLQGVKHDEVGIDIIQKGLGSVTENDISLAASSGAIVLGFHVGSTVGAEKFAKDENVDMGMFQVIYELIDYAKDGLEKLLSTEVNFVKVGSLKILASFKAEQTFQIVGGRVEDGEMRSNTPVKIVRDGRMIGEGTMSGLQKDKKKVSSVGKGSECGMRIDTETTIEVDDIIESYQTEERVRTLSE